MSKAPKAPMPGPVLCPVCGTENVFMEIHCTECGSALHAYATDTPSLAAVASSNVDAVGYNRDGSTLYVRFLNGGLYAYFDVPEHVYAEFMEAESKGGFLAAAVKNRYEYARIN